MGGKRLDLDPKNNPLNIIIPFRVIPGRLSVILYFLHLINPSQISRAIGDIEAKLVKFGGNPNVIISKPEITIIKINKEFDFIFMASIYIFENTFQF